MQRPDSCVDVGLLIDEQMGLILVDAILFSNPSVRFTQKTTLTVGIRRDCTSHYCAASDPSAKESVLKWLGVLWEKFVKLEARLGVKAAACVLERTVCRELK
jgi:hypothetical protein